MLYSLRQLLTGIVCGLVLCPVAAAQQDLAPQARQPPRPPQQAPAGFQLNAIEQAFLDQVLEAWQRESGKINTFKCSFERWEYNVAFGPGRDIPLSKDKGEVSYQRPDKGSFQITEINTFRAEPIPPGQQPAEHPKGTWAKQAGAIGEHWVCDGKSVFEYRHDQKQVVERPIPPQMQGQAIADGPLPFLFGAEAAKLRQRYWLRVVQQPNQDPNEIWLVARPKHQEQAADFSEVEVILDRQRLLPKAMQVHLPNGSRHVYMFDLAGASINSPLARLQSLFDRPRVPAGWKRVTEAMPLEQAAQPGQPVR